MAQWVKRWGYWMAKKPTEPGIWRLKDGGFFVRLRVTDVTGKRCERQAALHDAKTPREARQRRDALLDDARAVATGQARTPTSWRAFAKSVLDRRVRRGSIESEATIDWWRDTLKVLVPVFGHMPATEVRRAHIQGWLDHQVAEWMTVGKPIVRGKGTTTQLVKLKPPTVNGWLRILRTISRAVAKDYDLPRSAFDGIEFFEEGDTYSREQPNALPPTVLHEFMRVAREKYPQHFPMMLLGFVTGLRPSSMRPLRRKGPEADIDWTTGLLYVRQSHSRRQSVMKRTKTKKQQVIALPPAMLAELKRHADELDAAGDETDLLFPGRGEHGLLTRNVLGKPFKAIADALGLEMRITPRGMRRTFNDVARAAGMNDVVTMSVSGHVTDRMRLHYSTAQDEEQRTGLGKVLDVALTGGKTGGKRGGDDA